MSASRTVDVDRTITVVVPTLRAERTLSRCLQSLVNQIDHSGAPFPVEVVVVDNHSGDETAAIARYYADIVDISGPERSTQRNRGAELGSGRWVCFIDADMWLEPTVLAEAVEEMRSGAAAVVLPELSFGEGFFARCRGLEKRIYLGDPATEAARVFDRARFVADGGWNTELTAGEDWELTDRYAQTGRIGRTTAFVHHDEGRVVLRNVFRKKRYYGQWLTAYLAGGDDRGQRMSPARILRRPGLLFRHPLLTVGLGILKLTDLAGIRAGMRSPASA